MKMNILKYVGLVALIAFGANAQAELPKANVSEITDPVTLATYKAKVVNVEDIEQVDNISKSEAVFELTPNRAWKFECDPNEAAGNEYLGWYADYAVSFDKPIAKNSMGLFGYYGDWSGIGFFAPLEVPADYKVPLLNFMTKKSNWTYSQIRNLVGTFVCGAFNLSAANAETTMTVELRLFDPSMNPEDIRDSSKWIEQGDGINTYVVKSVTYKLSDVMNVPAKDGCWPELEYAGIAAAQASIPAGFYALEEAAFVNLSVPKSVGDQATAYFKPVVKAAEVKIEVAEDVATKTEVIDEKGQAVEVPKEQQAAVQEQAQEKVAAAVEEITTNKAAQEKTDTGVTAEEILTVVKDEATVVKDSIKQGILKNTPEEKKEAVEALLNSKEVSSRINIKLESTGVTVETTEAVEVTVTKAVFDVKPLATVTVVTGTEEKAETNEFTTVIKNEDLVGKTLTVRLPLPKSFVNNVRIVYTSDDPNYPTPEEYLVPSMGGANGERYCEFQVTHFSDAEAYDTKEAIPVKYESADVLGIIRRTDSGSGKEGYENAIAVPWASRAANGELQQGMAVEDLITANGLGEGDELHVWIPDSGTTHQSVIGGGKVTRKGTYAIFRWNAAQQQWSGAKDMDEGTCPVGTDYLIPRGAAVWYKRANTTTGDYTIVGLVSNVCETAVASGTTSDPVMTLLVNPFPEAVDAAKIVGADGDELIVNRMVATGSSVSYTRKNDAWGQMAAGTRKIGHLEIPSQEFQAVATIPVANGQSFWYVSRSGAPTINWKSIKTVSNAD